MIFMSDSAKNIIKFLCDRFFELEYYPISLSALLDLPIDKLRDFTQKDISKFNKIDIKILRDLTTISEEEFLKLATLTNMDLNILNNAKVAATLIENAWTKRKEYIKKSQSKIVVAGLDYAGKTSLINRLMHNHTPGDLINLEPTIGANIQEFESDNLNLIIWDLGGQKSNLEEYIQEPEKFFIQLDVLFFVFDAQDDVRYEVALKYLNDLLEILEFLKEIPYILILINKVDPDIEKDPDFQIKLEYLSDKITRIFLKKPKNVNYEIIQTSIYNIYSHEPEIVKTIKNVFSKDIIAKKEKKEMEIDEKLQKILDINFKLMDKVVSELSDIKRVLYKLAPSDLKQSIYAVPFDKVPSEYVSTPKKIAKKPITAKIEKEKSKKKKKPKKLGVPAKIPKPIKLSPPASKIEETMDKLSQKFEESEQRMVLENLTPPKPPPKAPAIPSTTPHNIINPRSQIMSELKDIFKKRGIVKKEIV